MTDNFEPFFIALEVTRSCKMNCIFCRANAHASSYENELTTKEWIKLLDNIAEQFNPVIILTGGDPLEREDIFQIAGHCSKLGLYVALSSCGHSFTKEKLQKLKDASISRISLTLNGSIRKTHDLISGRNGSFDEVMKAIEFCNQGDISFQINTTVVKQNIQEVPFIMELAKRMGASAYFPFLFVPMGKGVSLNDQCVLPEEYEKLLDWLYQQRLKLDMHYEAGSSPFLDEFTIRPSCAPQFTRIVEQRKDELKSSKTKDFSFEEIFNGCMGGSNFVFISHTGKVQPCGMLELDCGDIRKEEFSAIWKNSTVLKELRTTSNYKGKCGICNYLKICRGCRARAYIITHDYLEEDSYCFYTPTKKY